MEIVDYGNPAYENDEQFECTVCGRLMDSEGVCGRNCLEADML
jgi:hypothetical protein